MINEFATARLAKTITGAATFGAMCRAMIRQGLQPITSAASTKEYSRVDATDPRTILLMSGTWIVAMAIMVLIGLVPNTLITTMAKISVGNAIIASITRWSMRSR